MNDRLPDSWLKTPLEIVAEVNPRSFCPLPSALELPVHFVPMSAVMEGHGGIDITGRRPLGEVQKGYTSFLPDDVLLAKITPCMENGKMAVVPELPAQVAFGSTEFHVIRSAGAVLAKWLGFYLSQTEFRRLARQNMTGSAGQMRVPAAWLASAVLPVAPLREQTRIVEKLEELLSDLDAGVAKLKAAQKKLAQYRQSLLKAAVEGALTGAEGGYPQKSLGDLVLSIGQGWSPRCDRDSVDDDEAWAVIKTTAIQPLHFDGTYNKKLPLALKPREHLELKPGDLLVTRAGPRSRVGITCLVNKTKKRLILCDKAYRLTCNKTIMNPAFLELVLNAPHVVNEIDTLKTGINDSGLNLTQDRFFTLKIPVPSLAEQAKVIEAIEMAVPNIEQQAKALEFAFTQSAAQRQNILKAAFSGQLVPQDPNDEPASRLLERIRAERASRAAGDTKRGRRPKGAA